MRRGLFEAAAARGHVEANIIMTNLLASGVAGTRAWPAAVERLKVEAAKIPRAQGVAGPSLRDGARCGRRSGAGSGSQSDQRAAYARMFEGLLTEQECGYLIAAAGEFEPSMVYDPAGQLVRDTIRTSDGATFHWNIEDPAIHAINRRIATASRTAYEAGEALQVLRYAPGQQYRPHFDWVAARPTSGCGPR